MNMQTDAFPESTRSSVAIAAPEIPLQRQIYWALRRELWENRSLSIAPLAVAGVAFLGFLLSLFHLPAAMRAATTLAEKHLRKAVEPYDLVGALIMGTFLFVAVFYCIETLQRERRDRSILFWKSLPVSDLTTVLAKAAIPFLILPLYSCAVAIVTQFSMFTLSCVVLGASGLSVSQYWADVSPFQSAFLLVYHVMTVHVLWTAPVFGWLLFVSAWARRAAFLWAVLPPLSVIALESLLFHSTHFAVFLMQFLSGPGTEANMMPGTLPMNPMTQITPGRFFTTPALWIGWAVAAGFLAAAVRLRRHREPN